MMALHLVADIETALPTLRVVPRSAQRCETCGLPTDFRTALLAREESCRCGVLGVTVAELLAREAVES